MKSFKFQQFELKQNAEVFRIGTDAVLLGVLTDLTIATNVLEIGTGSGVISLMLAQRFPQINILALDINKDAVLLADDNFKNSRFSDRIKVKHQDFKTLKLDNKLDAIVTNPPFFEVNDSTKDVLARQKLELNYKDIIAGAKEILTIEGTLTVIIPSFDEGDFLTIAKDYGLFLTKKTNVKGIVTADIKRVVLQFSLTEKKMVVEEFVVEKTPRVYSDQYLDATKDFHVFKEK